MSLSYWEYNTWLTNIDFTIVGSGIVGLTCALQLRAMHPKAKILVLDRGPLPQGASTKNAGFACFGSISEIRADLRQRSEEEVVALVTKRWEGIRLLRKLLGDHAMDYTNHGGHELFLTSQTDLYHACLEDLNSINRLLQPVFKTNPFQHQANTFGFKNIHEGYISNHLEAQLDTGLMMETLLRKVRENGVTVLNAVNVKSYSDMQNGVAIEIGEIEFQTKRLLLATNGFASELIKEDVRPARAQVLITKPIPDLSIKGTFHIEEGYYYFRNVDNRILLGGGRNLDIQGESTMSMGHTPLIQNRLEYLLQTIILPETPFEIDFRWSGIMGVGATKSPIVKQLSENVFCGVRLGGMGIAIGSLVGKELAELVP